MKRGFCNNVKHLLVYLIEACSLSFKSNDLNQQTVKLLIRYENITDDDPSSYLQI